LAPHTTDPENDLLAEAIVGLAAVEVMRERAVPGGVLWQVGVEQETGTVKSETPSLHASTREDERPGIQHLTGFFRLCVRTVVDEVELIRYLTTGAL